MKKIISSLIFIALLFSLALSLVACSEGMVEYYEAGLHFKLPKNFRKLTLQGIDFHYSTPEASFEIQILPKSEFEDVEMGYYIDFDMTVKEYTEFFIKENKWECEYTYDETRDATTFFFFWSPEEDGTYTYYYITIMKNSNAFYIILMSCLEKDYPTYADAFRVWNSYITLDK